MIDTARVGAALGNEKRYAILKAIYRGALQTCCDRFEAWENGACVADVVGAFKLSQSTVSHHLVILEEAGLIRRETRGLWTLYFPRAEAIEAFTAALREELLQGGGPDASCQPGPEAGGSRQAP